MGRVIKTIPCEQGELFVTSAGQRLSLAAFEGYIKIIEHTRMVPILGTLQKGEKTIHASFMICGNLEYRRENIIHSGKVYDAVADVEGEQLTFAGMTFENSDPIANELTFRITDLELIQKLLEK